MTKQLELTQEILELLESACDLYYFGFDNENPEKSLIRLLEAMTDDYSKQEYEEFRQWKDNQ